eukprot:767140-Hanusia_phi.AAC.1
MASGNMTVMVSTSMVVNEKPAPPSRLTSKITPLPPPLPPPPLPANVGNKQPWRRRRKRQEAGGGGRKEGGGRSGE